MTLVPKNVSQMYVHLYLSIALLYVKYSLMQHLLSFILI